MQDTLQICQDHGLLFQEVETEIMILNQYKEMIELGQLSPDDENLNKMREIVIDAYTKAKRLPLLIVNGQLIDLAYFSAILGERSQTLDALNRIVNSKQSLMHFPLQLQKKVAVIEQLFSSE